MHSAARVECSTFVGSDPISEPCRTLTYRTTKPPPLIKELRDGINNDRYPLFLRIRTLRGILAGSHTLANARFAQRTADTSHE
jgi:hypothetical protein